MIKIKRKISKSKIGASCINSILIMLIGFVWSAFADDAGSVKFKQLTIKQGLSQSRIYDIVQDSYGFIWIASEDGLNRYDGYKFDIFSFDPDNPNSLSNQTIMDLVAADSGNIWIGTSLGGLNKYIAAQEKFISYQHNPADTTSIPDNFITDMSKDKKGNLWVIFSYSIIGYVDTRTGKCTVLDFEYSSTSQLNNRQIFFVQEDSRGTVWIGTADGLYRYYPDTKAIKVYHANNNEPTSISDSEVHCMYEDSRGQLWFGTNDGLNLFKIENETFTDFKVKIGAGTHRIAAVSSILEDKNGILWVGTWGNGLYRIDRQMNDVSQYRSDPDDLTSLSEDAINILMEDRTGEVWVGTDLNGISKIDRAATRFRTISTNNSGLSHNQVRDFYVDTDGIIWLGTAGGGLNRYDRRTNEWRVYRNQPGNPRSLSHDVIRTLYRDKNGTMWVGTVSGLNRFNEANGTFKRIYINPENPLALENMIGYEIIENPAYPNIIWFGSSAYGLCSYDSKKRQLKTYIIDTVGVQPSAKNFVKSLAFDRNDPSRLYVGANDGFYIFDIKTETFKSYRTENKNLARRASDNIMSFYQDNENNLWIATYGGGFMCFNLDTEETKIFTVQNSDLPSNGVYSIIPDNNGFFWLSSNRGISRFDPRSGIFKNYTVDDGLQNDEFNGGAYYKSYSGEFFFGGIDGFNSFFPESIKDNDIAPEVMITGFKIFNQDVKPGEDSPLSKNISLVDHIELAHWQNDISFEFVGLHFFRPENNKYEYILENYDPDWRQVGKIRNAVYTNLDPGEYTFRVHAANSDGIWNNEGKAISILIQPPWWKTGWAYAGYVLLLGFVVFAFDRFQRYRLTQRERQRAQIREAELRAQAAEAENSRKSQELEEARKLQLALLPEKLPELPNLQIAVYMKTATEVGGDYYDFNISADGTLNVAMGDATGHGMQAGTVVTLMKGLFSADAGRMEITDFFSQSNEALKNLRFGRMMMAFTLIKIKDDNLTISSAGMPPIFIYRPANMKIDEIMHESMPLGAFKSFDYQVHQSKLSTGDTMLLFSDGLPELKNPDGAQFDYPRVEQIFKEEAGKSSQEIIDRLVDAGDMWRKGQAPDDDVTMMVIKAR